jgi:hypothetical protein
MGGELIKNLAKPKSKAKAPKRPRTHANTAKSGDLSLVQVIARELAGDRIRSSLVKLARHSQIGLDSLRQLKRSPDAAGARTISSTRLRLLALLIAIHRRGIFDEVMDQAEELEREWYRSYPRAFR